MLVQATEIKYDYTNNTVAAVGNVQIYYGGATIEADQVIYDQKTKRLRAQGNVRLTEPDGKITYGQMIDLTDDYRDGFVDSLRLETPDDTRFAAARADRAKGNYTVLQNGVYTACEPCKDDPKKPPLWQVQAARIIHDEGEKMLYFEDARVEFFGVPLAYVPVHVGARSDREAQERISVSEYLEHVAIRLWLRAEIFLGARAQLRPHAGDAADDETRRCWSRANGGIACSSGSYSIKAAGIFQADPGYFAGRDGPGQPDREDVSRRYSDRGPIRDRPTNGCGDGPAFW